MTKQTNDREKGSLRSAVTFVTTALLFCAVLIATNYKSLTLTNSFIMVGCVLMFMGSLTFYVYYYDREVAKNSRKVATLCTTMLVSYALIWVSANVIGVAEVAPFALCSLIVSLLVSNKSNFFANFIVIIFYYLQSINFQSGSVSFVESDFFVLFAGITCAVIASYAMRRYYARLAYVLVGLVLSALTVVCRLLIYLMANEVADWLVIYPSLLFGLASGVVTVILLFFLLPVFERIFNVVSPFRFAEIATTNNAIMRKLYETAPGTFNHSLTVANYVEACASAIGESTFLARAVAYYHDIGKMKNPGYFTENQTDGVNPHDQITPESSVSIIKSHTSYGLALAKQYKLPVEIQRAIVEHHGTMPLKFFYLKAKKYTDGDLPYAAYSYDGPKPSSKIAAILMICDACEAALRSMNDKNRAEKIVDDIVDERMRFNQFVECDITMQEIDVIKNTILTTYMGIKHKRIQYPKIKLDAEGNK